MFNLLRLCRLWDSDGSDYGKGERWEKFSFEGDAQCVIQILQGERVANSILAVIIGDSLHFRVHFAKFLFRLFLELVIGWLMQWPNMPFSLSYLQHGMRIFRTGCVGKLFLMFHLDSA